MEQGQNQNQNRKRKQGNQGQKNIHAKPRAKRSFPVNIHIIFLCAIVLIAGFCAYRLYRWNKGVPSDYDPDYQTDAFDIEVMDSIIPLAPDKLEGREDDGVTTILCLGDDPFSLNQGENGLAEQIAAKADATVYNGSFTGTTMAAQFESYNDGYILDAFSFAYVAQSLASGDFDLMKTAATYSYDEAFPRTTAMLEALDLNTVDVICIMYDASDYMNRRPCDDPNNPTAIITYTGALRSGVQAIQEAYPHIRIAVMSHTFCHWVNEEGNFENADRVDLGHGTISHYHQKELDAASDCGVSFIDNFYGSVNEDNYLDYMTDYIHFNDAGRTLLAERFVQCIFPDDK
ncbi:MAG: SGNH/GDSL hydrolase family protein [Muribaculaceae bacterium]|nr:SGNH/GDSL hydrolase family protein [Muribaculaceae bacterium]